MRILFINYECPPLGGGGGVASFQLAVELAKQHEVDYLTMGYHDLLSSENVNDVHIIRVPVLNRKNLSTATYISMLSFVPAAFLKGILLCKKRNYDCIHAFFVVPSGICGLGLSRLFRIPLIMTALGGDVYDPSKRHSPHTSHFMRPVITSLFNRADMNTVESTNLKELILQYYPIKKSLQVIPLGFTKPVFPHKNRTDLQIPENKIIFLSVGRLVKRKGFEYSIKALSQISGHWFHYYILGDGPDEQELKILVSTLGMCDQVTFLGHVTDELKFQYLDAADIYLLPSIHEGFGICLLEAMHCGLPIVSTNNGGQEDILKDRENALFADTYDSNTFAKRILELLENTTLQKVISSNNRKDVTRYYINKIAKRYEELYQDVTPSR
jgi:glycosyltransferase involved in cell wall biosynthesis